MASETYDFLKKIYSGEEVSRWEYPDKLIYDVRPGKYPHSTQITIAFDDDDDFLDVLGIDMSGDDKYIWAKFMSRGYYDYDYDRDRYENEWEEGYVVDSFNEEQKNKIREILKLTNPKLQLNDDNNVAVSKFLESVFPNQVDNIKYDYSYEHTECVRRAVVKNLESETKNPFMRFGIIEVEHAYKFRTTVGILLKWYNELNVQDEDLKGLLKAIIEKYDRTGRGEWYELEYNVWCNDLDRDSLDRSYNSNLDSILEEAEEGLENNPDFKEYSNMLAVVNNLGGFDTDIRLSIGGQVKFLDIDIDTNKLKFIYTKPNEYRGEVRSVDNVEDLNLELYHPKLFESIRKIIKKLL